MAKFEIDIETLRTATEGLGKSLEHMQESQGNVKGTADALIGGSWEGAASEQFAGNVQKWDAQMQHYMTNIAQLQSLQQNMLPALEALDSQALAFASSVGGGAGGASKKISLDREAMGEAVAQCGTAIGAYGELEQSLQSAGSQMGSLCYCSLSIDGVLSQCRSDAIQKKEQITALRQMLLMYQSDVDSFEQNVISLLQGVETPAEWAERVAQEEKDSWTHADVAAISGLIIALAQFTKNGLESALQDGAAEKITELLVTFIQHHNPLPVFAAASVYGPTVDIVDSSLVQSIMGNTAKAAPFIGCALDVGMQIASGEDVGDAIVKAGAHTLIGTGLTVAATAIIGATPVGWAAAGVFALGVGASMLFDWAYDRYADDVKQAIGTFADQTVEVLGNVGDAISETFSGLCALFA